ncbi:MAG TPA: FecR family protein [Candidatus Ozemobacteraceae bacterium]|nr:FecR family protein [Candidatus Ozemobacteraceae bacterium]
MKTWRTFLLGFCITAAAFAHVPCQAEIKLSGTGTTPPAPANLEMNARFSCASSGNGTLTYSDGTHLNIQGTCEGQIIANGVQIKTGNVWVAYRKIGQHFAVRTPFAVIGVRGTDFGVHVDKDSLSVVLVKGTVEITPTKPGNNPVTLSPGQTFFLESGTTGTRPSTASDLEQWKIYSDAIRDSSSRMPSFSDQYLFGLTIFEAGSASLVLPNGTADRVPTQGTLIKSGSSIKTPAGSYARASLLCGSKIMLAPESAVKVGPLSLGIEAGTCLIRHVGKSYPLKIDGPTPVLIERGSVVEVERISDGLLMRVEAGVARDAGTKEKICAGECGKIDGKGISKVDQGPVPLAWEDPAIQTSPGPEETADADIFQPGSSPSDSAVTTQEPQPVDTQADPASQGVSSETGNLKNLRDTLGF